MAVSFTPPPRPAGRLSPTEAANSLGIRRQTVCRYCREHGIAERVDGRWWIIPERLQAFVAQHGGSDRAGV